MSPEGNDGSSSRSAQPVPGGTAGGSPGGTAAPANDASGSGTPPTGTNPPAGEPPEGAPVTPAPSRCEGAAAAPHPFGCDLAWGTNDPGGSLSGFDYLDFMSKWVGYEVDEAGGLARCDGCAWLQNEVASTALLPVYYAYFIGFFGHANGFMDGNQNPDGPNLTTEGARLIRDHRQTIIDIYAEYAAQSQAVWPDRPIVWLLEGDHVQYAGESQHEPLSYAELGELTAEIACAIKANMPRALVAINHSTWNPDQVTDDFWNAMAGVAYDLVWTTGVPDNDGFFEAGAQPDSYNHRTATYAYVHALTGREILVDTSFGLSAMADSWSSADPATLEARIADGVIAVNVAEPSAGYRQALEALRPQLPPVCR